MQNDLFLQIHNIFIFFLLSAKIDIDRYKNVRLPLDKLLRYSILSFFYNLSTIDFCLIFLHVAIHLSYLLNSQIMIHIQSILRF